VLFVESLFGGQHSGTQSLKWAWGRGQHHAADSGEGAAQHGREIMLFIGKPKGRSMMISNATNPLKESRKSLY